MSQILIGSIERGEIDNQFDRIMSNFAKQHLNLCKLATKLPQQDKFYFDLFSCAFNLVSQRKSQSSYQQNRSILFENIRKFFEMACVALEEKKHYPGAKNLDFENHISFDGKPLVPKVEPQPIVR